MGSTALNLFFQVLNALSVLFQSNNCFGWYSAVSIFQNGYGFQFQIYAIFLGNSQR